LSLGGRLFAEINVKGAANDCVTTVVISESSIHRLRCTPELFAAEKAFALVRCPGTLADVIACCRRFECCVLILEGSYLRDADRLTIAVVAVRPFYPRSRSN